MDALVHTGLQGRNLCLGLRGGGDGLLQVERGGQPRLHAPARDLQGFLLQRKAALRKGQALLQAAQLDVADRHLGRQRHAGVGQTGFGRQGVGLAGRDAGGVAAEEVGLPTGVEARLEAVARRVVARFAALARAAGAQRRAGGGAGDVLCGACLAQRCLGRADAGVGGERLRDQLAQRVVAEALPPVGQRGGIRTGGCGRPLRRHGQCRRGVALRRGRGAAGDHEGCGHRQNRCRPLTAGVPAGGKKVEIHASIVCGHRIWAVSLV